MRTNHIFPETLVYSVRTPTLDELLKVHEERVWSHPVVKLEILKQWRNRDYGNKSQNINKKSDNYLIPKIIKSLSRYYVANVSHILNKKRKRKEKRERINIDIQKNKLPEKGIWYPVASRWYTFGLQYPLSTYFQWPNTEQMHPYTKNKK